MAAIALPRVSRAVIPRAAFSAGLAALVFALPMFVDTTWNTRFSLAAIYAIIGLSVNVITGHAGQISLGHQAFVGIGAFMSSYLVTRAGTGFYLALILSGVMGAVMAALLGLVALRIRGLYLALVTVSFGLMAETTIFNWRSFTGGGAGAEAPRPAAFTTDKAYAYLCLIVLALVITLDWRLTKTKAGRAIVAFRNDERIAATLGVNVTGYKLLAFVTGGFIAGLAGSLFAHWNQFVQALDFNFQTALVWVLMAVVGGLGSRAGVVVGSAFFAIFPLLFPATTIHLPLVGPVIVQVLSPLVGAFLLLFTLVRHPTGIGGQLMPIRRWLAGGPFVLHERRRTEEPAAEPEASSEGAAVLEEEYEIVVLEPDDEHARTPSREARA